MKSGIDKCDALAMNRGKEVEYNGIELEDGEEIGQIGEEGYKYLDILKKGDICQEEMEKHIREEYFKRLRVTLKPKLNVEHVFQKISTWPVPTVWYSAGIESTKEKVKEME